MIFFSKPIKVYEYMAAGLPYICSDFPDWEIVANESGAGICINPGDPIELRKAIELLNSNRELAQEMGKRGRNYVVNKCNWDIESNKLRELYKSLL